MTESTTFLAERLITEGEKSIKFFSQLPAQDWSKSIYTDGAVWTLHEVLAHFVSAEISLCKLVDNIAKGGPGSPEDFDIDAYNNRKVSSLKETPIAELLEQFRQNRQKTAQLVITLQPEDLERQGRHPFLGIVALSEIIKIIYRHNQIHQREIRNILEEIS